MEFFIDNRFKKLQQISSRLGSYDSLPSFFLYNEDSVVLPKSVRDDLFVQITEHQSALLATAESLHGLIELRVNPTDTQRSLQMLKSAFKKFPENAALCNCIGEVLGQAGDAAGAMVEFRKAYLMSPNNPMPMLNAARVYQQLGQSVASEAHIREAMLRDNTLVLAYVDCAQLCLQAARGPAIGSAASDNCGHKAAQAKKAEVYLEKAVTLCRHISEIADVFATKAIAKIHLDVLEQNSSSHLF